MLSSHALISFARLMLAMLSLSLASLSMRSLHASPFTCSLSHPHQPQGPRLKPLSGAPLYSRATYIRLSFSYLHPAFHHPSIFSHPHHSLTWTSAQLQPVSHAIPPSTPRHILSHPHHPQGPRLQPLSGTPFHVHLSPHCLTRISWFPSSPLFQPPATSVTLQPLASAPLHILCTCHLSPLSHAIPPSTNPFPSSPLFQPLSILSPLPTPFHPLPSSNPFPSSPLFQPLSILSPLPTPFHPLPSSNPFPSSPLFQPLSILSPLPTPFHPLPSSNPFPSSPLFQPLSILSPLPTPFHPLPSSNPFPSSPLFQPLSILSPLPTPFHPLPSSNPFPSSPLFQPLSILSPLPTPFHPLPSSNPFPSSPLFQPLSILSPLPTPFHPLPSSNPFPSSPLFQPLSILSPLPTPFHPLPSSNPFPSSPLFQPLSILSPLPTPRDLGYNLFHARLLTFVSTLTALSSLKDLFLHYNWFIGSIPSSLFALPSLTGLGLFSNYLTGTIPPIPSSLVGLDVAYNFLSGSLPPHSLKFCAAENNCFSSSLSSSCNFYGTKQRAAAECAVCGMGDAVAGGSVCWDGVCSADAAAAASQGIPNGPTRPTLAMTCVGSTVVSIRSSSSSALLALKSTLGVTHTTWVSSMPCAIDGTNPWPGQTWSGVRCDATGNVTFLDLSYQQLKGSLHSDISKLTTLTHLSLHANLFWMPLRSIFSPLSTLTNLKTLQLQYNWLYGSMPAALLALPRLTRL
ncbi:unnamed protein product, partial [Closterium sp. Naga37s-1]